MKTTQILLIIMLTLVSTSFGITFSNTSSINIQFDGEFPSSPIPADLYPSQIEVSGIAGPVQNVSVTLHDMSHTWPADLNILLVGPTGQTVVLMANVGSSMDIDNIDLIFDDDGQQLSSSQIMAGVYSPTGTTTIMEPRAPSGPYGTTLSGFDGLDPVGTWSLYVMDSFGSEDGGSIAGGWSLSLEIPVFTYQGRLLDDNVAADGLYDIQFKLYDRPYPAIASQIGSVNTREDVKVNNGYFNTELAFGDNVFNGDKRWLQVAVRPFDSSDPGDYVALSPLQPITPTPYVLGAIDYRQITGLLGYEITLALPDVYYNRADVEIESIEFTGQLIVIHGPGYDIDRIEGFSGDHPDDQPGFSAGHPLIFECSGADADAMQTYFDLYFANPEIVGSRDISLVTNDLAGTEKMRWNAFFLVPQTSEPGDDGRTRFTLVSSQIPGTSTIWMQNNPGGVDAFGGITSNNPLTDTKVDIEGVAAGVPSGFYPQVEIDTDDRTVTLTYDFVEGNGIYDWVMATKSGIGIKRSMSIIDTDWTNYFGVFPIKYEIIDGFGLDTKVKASVVLSYDVSEIAT